MGRWIPPEDLLSGAIVSKQPQVRLERCPDSIENVFRNVLKKDRRMLAMFSGYEARPKKRGLIQFCTDYDVTLQYGEGCPDSVDDVLLDEGDWDARSIMGKSCPNDFLIVTADSNGIFQKVTEIGELLQRTYEGLSRWDMDTNWLKELTEDVVCRTSFSYIIPEQQLRKYQGKAAFAAKNIWKTILGKSKVPQFVKPFLALSYITQECAYDQRAFDEVESDPMAIPSDPIPHLAYGPLCEQRGICGGLAWAFKVMMDSAGIECICVDGYLKEDLKTRHMWDMVKLDGQYYHVDPTWGIKDSGVYVDRLLQPDPMLKSTHIWKDEDYPRARGVRFDYDYIEEFLLKNGRTFLDDGANDKYFFPDEIVE